MEIKEKTRQLSITANTSNGEINYDLNYNIKDGELTSLNGTVSKIVKAKVGDTAPTSPLNLGSFSIGISVDNPTINLNLNDNCVISDKQAVLADIYTIMDELKTIANA